MRRLRRAAGMARRTVRASISRNHGVIPNEVRDPLPLCRTGTNDTYPGRFGLAFAQVRAALA